MLKNSLHLVSAYSAGDILAKNLTVTETVFPDGQKVGSDELNLLLTLVLMNQISEGQTICPPPPWHHNDYFSMLQTSSPLNVYCSYNAACQVRFLPGIQL